MLLGRNNSSALLSVGCVCDGIVAITTLCDHSDVANIEVGLIMVVFGCVSSLSWNKLLKTLVWQERELNPRSIA